MMKGFFKTVSLLTVLMMIAGSAMAYDQAYHVKQAKNGKGDALIFPLYYAAPGGWETKISVINTDPVNSVIAKIVFRSHFYSQEVLDFLLYLTPGDVWVGFVRHDGTNVYVYSEDDSVLTNNTVFASKTSPMRQNMFAVKCPKVVADERTALFQGDSSDIGYIEVVEGWYGNVSSAANYYPEPNPTTLSTKPPVSKDYLRQLYTPTEGEIANAQPGRLSPRGAAAPIIHGAGIDRTINVLTGYMEIRNPLTPNMGAMLQATVLADLDPTNFVQVKEASGITSVIGNGQNTLGEIEAVLSKNNIALPYVNDPATGQMTVHVFNFPTKNSDYASSSGSYKDPVTGECRYWDTYHRASMTTSPFWFAGATSTSRANVYYRCLAYANTVYDLMENSTGGGIFSGGSSATKWCEEVELVATSGYSSIFTEGWTQYLPSYDNRALYTKAVMARNTGAFNLVFTGTPVIPVSLMFKTSGMSLVPGAYEDGAVYAVQNLAAGVDPSPFLVNDPTLATYNRLAEYQYWNAMHELGDNTVVYPSASLGVGGAGNCNAAPNADGTGLTYWGTQGASVNVPCLPIQAPKK